jgi:hypothetical protein
LALFAFSWGKPDFTPDQVWDQVRVRLFLKAPGEFQRKLNRKNGAIADDFSIKITLGRVTGFSKDIQIPVARGHAGHRTLPQF